MNTKLFILLVFLSSFSFSQSNLTINNPRFPWATSGVKNANITDAFMEITPHETYATCEFTYTTNTVPAYFNNYDSLEARLFFSMPENSYFYDSWLWLDNTNIIKAELIERNAAINTYLGIVKRRRDPSLLFKNGNNYEFDIFPIMNNYPRKVKLSFVVAITSYNGIRSLPVAMTDILSYVNSATDYTIKINKTNAFFNPDIKLNNLSASTYMINNNNLAVEYYFPASITNSNFKLSVENAITNIKGNLNIYPVSANEGYYEMSLNTDSLYTNSNYSKNLNIIFNLNYINSINTYYYNYNLIVDSLYSDVKQTLYKLIGTVDSFNLFYEKNNVIVNRFGSWVPLNTQNINSMFSGLNNIVYGTHSKFDSLLMKGIDFTQKSNSNNAITLIYTNDTTLSNINIQNSMQNKLLNYLGSINKPINVYDFSCYYYYQNFSNIYPTEPFWRKLCNNSDGFFTRAWLKYAYNNGSYKYYTTLNYQTDIIKEYLKETTEEFYFDLPLSSGFKYNEYNSFKGTHKFILGENNFEIGKYFGTIDTSLGIGLSVKMNGVWNSINYHNIYYNPTDTKIIKQNWVNMFINANIPNTYQYSTNSSLLYKEILDSSLNNSVLCTYTAFLALDTGDTINIATDRNSTSTNAIETLNKEELQNVKIFPNPFTQQLTIESDCEIYSITITNLLGKKILEQNNINNTNYTISINENDWYSGTYIALVKTKKGIKVIKLVKI